MLQIPGTWVWDSWVADDGDRYHLFFLKAPSSLGDTDLRHTAASVGHATSTDLTDWHVEPDAFGPLAGSWDDLAIWTGSVARGDDDVWRLFYTALGTRGLGARDQRIGVAESADLATFTRVGGTPVLLADPRWYRTVDEDGVSSETWRDPFVLRVPGDDRWHMIVTARGAGLPRRADGVLAHATSDDMLSWTVGPPITRPAGFGQLEVAQVHRVGDAWVLVFTCAPEEQADEHLARFGRFSTWSMTAASPLGPWDLALARPFEAEPTLFAAPLVRRRDGGWALLGFRNTETQGSVALEIVDPIAVRLEGGRLVAID